MTGFLIDAVRFVAPLVIFVLAVWFVTPLIMDTLRHKQGEMRIKLATRQTEKAMEKLRRGAP